MQALVRASAESKSNFFPLYVSNPTFAVSRFSETEAIAIITMLVSKYRISIKEEPTYANETFEERKTRILACTMELSLTYGFQFR